MHHTRESIIRLLEDCFFQKLTFESRIEKNNENKTCLQGKIQQCVIEGQHLSDENKKLNNGFANLIDNLNKTENRMISFKNNLSTYINSDKSKVKSNQEKLTPLISQIFELQRENINNKNNRKCTYERDFKYFNFLLEKAKTIERQNKNFCLNINKYLKEIRRSQIQNQNLDLNFYFENIFGIEDFKVLFKNLKEKIKKIKFNKSNCIEENSFDKGFFVGVELNIVLKGKTIKKIIKREKCNLVKEKGEKYSNIMDSVHFLMNKYRVIENRLIFKMLMVVSENSKKLKELTHNVEELNGNEIV